MFLINFGHTFIYFRPLFALLVKEKQVKHMEASHPQFKIKNFPAPPFANLPGPLVFEGRDSCLADVIKDQIFCFNKICLNYNAFSVKMASSEKLKLI